MQNCYEINLVRMVKKFTRYMKDTYEEMPTQVRMAVNAFKAGLPFLHHSDDQVTIALVSAALCVEIMDMRLYYYKAFGLVHSIEGTPKPSKHLLPHIPYFQKLYEDFYRSIGKYDPLFFNGMKDYEINGIVSKMDILSFSERVCSWGKITTTFDEKGDILEKGAEFLKHYFWLVNDGKHDIIIPRRDRMDLYPRLLKPTSSLKSIVDYILKIRTYLYATPGNEAQYNEFKAIHDAFMKKLGRDITVEDLSHTTTEKILTRMRYKLGLIDDVKIITKIPSYGDVLQFYKPGKDHEKKLAYMGRQNHFSSVSIMGVLANEF